MNNSDKGAWVILGIIVIVVLAIALVYFMTGSSPSSAPTQTATTQNIQAVYICDNGMSINATYVNATTATTTGNYVILTLSDGRQMTLPQTISADGARYANSDESFVFWSKGNGAFITENGTTTYNNCVTQMQ